MRRLPHVVFAATTLLLIGGCALLIAVLSRPPSPLESKIADAERNLYYRLDDRGGVALGLPGREDQVKLIAHAVMPQPYREDRRVEFGVGVELWSPDGEKLLDADLYTSARQSKADLRDGLYRHENAFSLESKLELSDDRVLLVTLPLSYPLGSELRLRRLGEPSEVIVRAYARRRRSTTARKQTLLLLESSERDELIARSTYLPWVFIPASERRRRVAYRFDRLAAVGELGDDFRTVAVWYTGYRRPRRRLEQTDATPPALTVSRTASLALPVSTTAAVSITNRSSTGAKLSLTQITATEATATAIDLAAGGTTEVQIAPTAATLQVTSESAEPLSVSLVANDRVTGERRTLTPRWVTTRWTPIAADRPAVISLARSTDQDDRQLRLTARAVGPAAEAFTSAQLATNVGDVSVVYLAANGGVLGRQTVQLSGERSRFDYVDAKGGKVSAVGEAVVARFLVPVGADRVRVETTSAAAAIRPALFAPAQDPVDSTAALQPIPPDYRWRFSRQPTALWFDVIPDGAQQIALRGQRRAEPRRIDPGKTPDPP